MKIQLSHKFADIISIDNLLSSWQEFIRGKRKRRDVQEFFLNLMDNILELHHDLKSLAYKHGGYQAFEVNDPKPRDIHKATVRDRLLHRAVYRVLYPFFERNFVSDSFSCRLNKGTDKAIRRFHLFAHRVSKNNTKTAWILKCDIKKFFASIDQNILISILERYIPDKDITNLLKEITFSFKPNGLPLGNLTSQLFANVYLNEFDQFIKHQLKIKFYIRYADDFIIFSQNKEWLENLIETINEFLSDKLKLRLHSDKVFIKTLASGVNFLGLVNFPDYRILRTKTKRRMLKKIDKKHEAWRGGLMSDESFNQSLQSYLGMLKHCNGYEIKEELARFTSGFRLKAGMTNE